MREFCESRKTLPPSVGRGAILYANELGIVHKNNLNDEISL